MDSMNIAYMLSGYEQGMFPRADDETGVIYWYSPDPRAILPLDGLRISRSLRKVIDRKTFTIKTDVAFEEVVRSCAQRSSTWISEEIIRTFCDLHKLGYAHSVECWLEDTLAGGLFGISLGAAFFGESMFHTVTDASKVALAALVSRLNDNGFLLLDIQFMTDHLKSLGATEIPKDEYLERLETALSVPTTW